MLYYTITKNNEIIGIGNTQDIIIPKNDTLYKYKEITELEYNNLNNTQFKK